MVSFQQVSVLYCLRFLYLVPFAEERIFIHSYKPYLGQKVRSQHQRVENQQSPQKMNCLPDCDVPDSGAAVHC